MKIFVFFYNKKIYDESLCKTIPHSDPRGSITNCISVLEDLGICEPSDEDCFMVRHVCEVRINQDSENTIDSEGFKGGTRGAPIMPRDAVSRTANVERTVRHKWVNSLLYIVARVKELFAHEKNQKIKLKNLT